MISGGTTPEASGISQRERGEEESCKAAGGSEEEQMKVSEARGAGICGGSGEKEDNSQSTEEVRGLNLPASHASAAGGWLELIGWNKAPMEPGHELSQQFNALLPGPDVLMPDCLTSDS